jgi:diamine N-acetyltransferase
MIYAEKIRLRAIEKDDLPTFTGWFNDPEVRHGLMVFLPMSLSEEEQWFQGVLKRPHEERPLVIDVEVDDKWVTIGNCGFFDINWRIRSAEVGICIGEKQYWNKGFGTQSMQLILQHGFNTLNLNRISLHVYENNPRAVCAYEKAGFVHEGRMRQAHYQDGQYYDAHLMSVVRSEWKEE